MSENLSDTSHGDSVASWTAVIIIMVAVAAGTLAFWFDQAVLVWASAGLVVVGVIAGFVLRAAGYGVNGSKSKSSH